MVSNAKKRIFIAINLDEEEGQKLVQIQNKISRYFPEDNPIVWTKKENLHITVFFIGFVYDTDLLDIFNQVEKATKEFKPFFLKFNEIDFMPKENNKKMVWVFGEQNKELENMRRKIKQNVLSTEKETESFTSHITMGRITQWILRKINPEEIPNINDEIPIDFEILVDSIDIMESELKKGGSKYTILKTIKL